LPPHLNVESVRRAARLQAIRGRERRMNAA